MGHTRILLAEDDFELRSLLASTLEREGYAVTAVATGAELRSCIDALVRDAAVARVITDERMPGGGGLATLARARLAGARLPLVLMSGHVDDTLLARARLMGIDVLEKPFGLDDLRALVDRLIPDPPASTEDAPHPV